MESFEEQQSDRLEEIIPQLRDIEELENVEARFKDVAHPNIGSLLGIRWLIFGYKDDAFSNLVNSAVFGLSPTSEWVQTGYADSIGQSIFHLLNEFKYKDSFNDIKFKLIANAYICFSGLIRAMGEQAFDSLRTRAKLIELIDKEPAVKQFLNKYYYEGNDLCTEILTISDRVLSSIGYKNIGDIETAKDSDGIAQAAYQKIVSLPQYYSMRELGIRGITKISQQNQEHLFQNVVKDFVNGGVSITEKEFRERIENERIEERPYW